MLRFGVLRFIVLHVGSYQQLGFINMTLGLERPLEVTVFRRVPRRALMSFLYGLGQAISWTSGMNMLCIAY